MARKTYVELKGIRAHYEAETDEVVLTSTSLPLKRAGFKVLVDRNTRGELAIKHILRKEGALPGILHELDIDWNDDNCLAVAGKSGIGKTAFACIMAAALSDVGKKVLLVDTIAGTDRVFRFAHHSKRESSLSEIPELEFVKTPHGWDVLIAPQEQESLQTLRENPERVYAYIERLKKEYDVLIFDTSERFLTGSEYSPFLRYFSNVLVLTHPYSTSYQDVHKFMAKLPSEIKVNCISSDPHWLESPHREQCKLIGSWPHMQDFYRMDNDSLLSRGEPLVHMHSTILPHLPLPFMP